MDEQLLMVSAAPNESTIRGKIVEIELTPEGQGHIWKVKILESKNVEGLANFTRPLIGRIISIYVHPDFKKKFNKSDAIEARVKFIGDTLNGAFFLVNDSARHFAFPSK